MITPFDPDFADAMTAYARGAKKFRNALRTLACQESALARPRHKFAHAKRADMAALAAAYAFELVKNQGLVDGNKRVAFVAPYLFPGLNGYDLGAIEPDVVTTTEGVAASRVSEGALAPWFRARLYRLSK